jgi:D-glycero-D-manno-heptose 1,7-bisphosphate phosphatase
VKRAVFLDRDGVINRSVVRAGKPYPPPSLEAMSIMPGVESALRSLRAAGLLNIVVTNQPDVATGVQRRETVEAMHAELRRALAIDEIRVCYHAEADGCACRKPRPGMLIDAARKHAIDLGASFMVGDRWRDVDAGEAAGCTTFFIDYGYDERRPTNPDYTVGSLLEASSIILTRISEKGALA